MYKRIYDSEEIVVDYCNDGKPMIRVSVFEDGHWVDEHFVELPKDSQSKSGDLISRSKLEKALLMIGRMYLEDVCDDKAYLPEQSVYEALRKAPAVDADPVVHARYDSEHCCTNCGEMALEAPIEGTYYHTLRCWACNAKMDKE